MQLLKLMTQAIHFKTEQQKICLCAKCLIFKMQHLYRKNYSITASKKTIARVIYCVFWLQTNMKHIYENRVIGINFYAQ